ncbi:hypothetical protein B0H17DRAFT_1192194 [Mycena rosella]|uniref:Uncharacterized protein n=1 Tax=Mycena rosella TaxID=1033263 RepID=A0AAD7GYE4_MYCRO|nr:hypothetical protein B0H17DRAFT_1192194 [Mycena rosella]
MMKTPWIIVVIASIIAWRSSRPAKDFLFKRNSPQVYYAEGDANHCLLKIAPDFRFCEDAAFWDLHDATSQLTRRTVLVACDPGRKEWNTVLGPLRNSDPHGALWLLSAEDHDGAPQRLVLENYPPNHDFHPLGIAVSPSYGNTSNLFVVNHARRRTVIEQFTLSPSSSAVATHVRTLSSPYFWSANSIALTSAHSFYVSNDHLMTRRLPVLGHILPILETLLGLPLGWISHISLDSDVTASTPILEQSFAALFIPFANGVSISPSGSQLAVASTSLSRVLIYSRDVASNALSHTDTIPVPFSPDNLEYVPETNAETSTLVVAGHPHFPSLLRVKADTTTDAVSPSWVVSIVPDTREVATLFRSNGTFFSSSSTGLRDSAGALYVTGLYAESGLLICRPNSAE